MDDGDAACTFLDAWCEANVVPVHQSRVEESAVQLRKALLVAGAASGFTEDNLEEAAQSASNGSDLHRYLKSCIEGASLLPDSEGTS
jgi:hypothetical protein